MDHATQEGARCDYNRFGLEAATIRQFNGRRPLAVECDGAGFGFHDLQIFGFLDQGSHGQAVQLSIGLRSRALDSRSFSPIEDAKLNARGICGAGYQSIHGVDFAHEVTLPEPADRRVARHHTNSLNVMCDESGPGSNSRGGRRGLATRMPAANYDDIESPGRLRG